VFQIKKFVLAIMSWKGWSNKRSFSDYSMPPGLMLHLAYLHAYIIAIACTSEHCSNQH